MNYSLSVPFALALASFVSACGGTLRPVAQAPLPAHEAPSYAAEAARDTPPLPKVKARSHDGSISLEVEATATPTIANESGLIVSIPIGAARPITCVFRNDSPDTSTLLRQIFIDSVLPAAQPESAEFHVVDVGLAGKRIPYFLADMHYRDKQNQGRGRVKAAAFDRPDGTLICMHEEPGFSGAFRRVAEQVATGLQVKGSTTTEPSEQIIAVLKIGSQPVGYAIDQHIMRSNGTHLELSTAMLLLSRSPSEIFSLASLIEKESTKDGTVSRLREVTSESGEVSRDVTLERSGKHYTAKGTALGKPIRTTLTPSKPFWAAWREREELHAKLFIGKKQELRVSHYSAMTPLSFETNIWRATTEPRVLERQGSTTSRITLDDEAHMLRETMSIGDLELVAERAALEKRPL